MGANKTKVKSSKVMQDHPTVHYVEAMDGPTLKMIQTLSGFGLTQQQIAYAADLKLSKFEWFLENDPKAREALDRGIAKANAQVVQKLFKLAVVDEVPSAIFFWCKTRMGWRETNNLDVAVRQNVVYRSTVRADGSLIQEVLNAEGKVIDVESEK